MLLLATLLVEPVSGVSRHSSTPRLNPDELLAVGDLQRHSPGNRAGSVPWRLSERGQRAATVGAGACAALATAAAVHSARHALRGHVLWASPVAWPVLGPGQGEGTHRANRLISQAGRHGRLEGSLRQQRPRLGLLLGNRGLTAAAVSLLMAVAGGHSLRTRRRAQRRSQGASGGPSGDQVRQDKDCSTQHHVAYLLTYQYIA